MHHLRSMGAIDVTRSYGSHGIIDVRAIFPDKVLLIQAKADYISKKELANLIDFGKKLTAPNIEVMLWKYHKKKKSWAIFTTSSPTVGLSLTGFKLRYAVEQKVLP